MGKIEELLLKHSVMVNQGSGCLFQPNDSDYTYVLTAKHCITDENKQILDKENISVFDDSGKKLDVKERYYHHTEDAAILTVEKIDGINLYYTSCTDSQDLILFGYPQRKRGEQYEFDKIDCQVNFELGDLIEIKSNDPLFTEEFSVKENTVGFSGCGVFKKSNDSLLLVGIVYRLSEERGVGAKILLQPKKCFMDIVSKNKKALAPLIPKHLTSFEDYKENIWNGFDSELDGSRIRLEDIAAEVIKKNITPMLICKLYRDKLCVPRNNDLVNDNELWSGWLELLTYCKLDNDLIESEKEQIEILRLLMKNRRFFYNSEVKEWRSLLGDIIRQDLRELGKGACIIVNTICSYTPRKTKVSFNNIVNDIGRVHLSRSRMRVDEGIDPAKDFTFIHLLEFKERIFDNDNLINLGYGDEEKITEELKKSIKLAFKNE